ncbi:hypothetical protein Tsubulata_000690 [Turnera subulata]|uniref:Uncharacterized protein n=1 Tax=Turnera subulata TaxID=218843 RepID=A0A9Q0J680_9ROSI|nr:hypothetical protein Tsubulata_000690 [Turnera subulata]
MKVSSCLSLSQLLSRQERSQLLSEWFPQLVPDPVESDTTPLRLVFRAEAISNLRAIITSTSVVNDSESLKYKPTGPEVVIAFIWMCLIRMNKARHGRLRRSLLSVAVSMLKKTTLPIPENSWGNFVTRAVARFSPGDDDAYGNGNVQLQDLAGKVHHAIESTLSDIAKASNVDEIVSLVDNANEVVFKGWEEPDTDSCNFASLCRFPIYEADYGWGKPCWVTVPLNKKMRNFVHLMDAFDGDGVEALVTLDQSGMHIFEQDPEIIPFLA